MNKITIAILLIFMSALIIVAQSTTGKLVGTVSAADGVVPGATITVTDTQTGKTKTVSATDDGTFNIPQLEFGVYSVKVSANGFKTFIANELKIDAGREYPLNVVLEVGQISEEVTITAGAEQINASNGEISTTVSPEQIRDLPLNGRNPLSLVSLQAGANITTNSINGQRSSSVTTTRDGLNVQDNFIRTNAFVSDQPTVDNTGEFTVTTQNAGSEQGGGSSFVQLVTPRGGREFHGAFYEFNRNSKFASNSFFNNANGLPKPFLNRNEFGASISGPAYLPNFGEGGPMFTKGKGFFFFNYEGFRLAQQATITNLTTLLPQARDGNFTYIDNTGTQRTINVLTGTGLASPLTANQGGVLVVDPIIKSRILDKLPNTANGITTGINFTQTLSLLRSDPRVRNAWTARFDYKFTDQHDVNFVYKRNTDEDARTDIAAGFSPDAFVNQGGPVNFLVGAYRFTPNSRFTNEFRAGFQYAEPFFNESNVPSDFLIGGLGIITSPEGTFRSQGRNTLYRNFQDTAFYSFGNHTLRFGGQAEFFKFQSIDLVGTTPTYTISTTTNPNTPGLINSQFTGGIDTTQLARANALRYLLGGIIGGGSRTANLPDSSSGYGFGPSNIFLNYEVYSAFVSDQWRIRPNLTLNMGVRYELYTPVNSPQALFLEPVIKNNDLVGSILDPNGTLDVVGGNAGKKGDFSKADKDNFAPIFSVAYSPNVQGGFLSTIFGGNATIRGSIGINYVNDEYVKSVSTLSAGNPGLGAVNTGFTNLRSSLSTIPGFNALPSLSNPPAFTAPPITFAANNARQNLGSQVFGVDPNLQLPRIYSWNIGYQRDIGFKTTLEVRYLGAMSNDLIRTKTFNQLDVKSNAFLDDFKKAQQNCRLQGATLPGAANAFDTLFICTDARFNPAIAGSQPLTTFNNLGGGGLLNNTATVIPLIQQGRVGSLAQVYITNGLTGTVNLVKNRNIFIDEILQNTGIFRFNALQMELRRRFTNGFSLQANYTFQKTLSDIPNEDQNRQGELQDNNNPRLQYGRTDFDRTHTFNANLIYELPFGKGKSFLNGNGWTDLLFGGFQFTSIVIFSSGPPLGIIDPRSTSTITFQSGRQSAKSTLSTDQIKELTGIFNTPNGIYFINPSVLNATIRNTTTGATQSGFDLNQPLPAGFTLVSVRGANALGTAPFNGQVFFFNGAGETGNLPINFLNGMPFLNWDAGLSKNFRIGEGKRLQLRMEAFNVLNNQVPRFSADLDVNSNSFGRVTTTFNGARVLQFGARFDF